MGCFEYFTRVSLVFWSRQHRTFPPCRGTHPVGVSYTRCAGYRDQDKCAIGEKSIERTNISFYLGMTHHMVDED